MALLEKTQIINAQDRQSKKVTVQQWGGEVILREMSGKERSKYENMLFKSSKDNQITDITNLKIMLVSCCLVDEKLNRMFSEEEVSVLNDKSGAVIDLLFDECQNINGLSGQAVEEAKKN